MAQFLHNKGDYIIIRSLHPLTQTHACTYIHSHTHTHTHTNDKSLAVRNTKQYSYLASSPGTPIFSTSCVKLKDQRMPGDEANSYLHTVFIRILAAATINFSLAGVRLLIEGGSYSRTIFINSSDTSW